MADRRPIETRGRAPWTRREWLGGVGLLALGVASKAVADPAPGLADTDRAFVEAVRERADRAGIKDVGASTTDHYVAAGNAPDGFRAKGLALCEELAATVLKHFRGKGYELTLPPGRMGVVALADRDAYAAFKGSEVAEMEGGHYDVVANRLVIFDFLDDAPARANVRRLNTFTLVHEAVHQLTYNTGILDREGDVPVAVSEGLATYCELWTLARPQVGQKNGYRATVLKSPGTGRSWLEPEELLTRDDLFDDEATDQLAYAEAWLLVHDLMQTRAGVARLRSYLDAIRPRRDAGHRIEDAEATLGDLHKLDSALKKRARNL